MNGQTAPQFVQAILEWEWTWPLARFTLVVFYLVSGLSKIADFRGAVAEMAEAGMPAPTAMALLSIFVELTGSLLVMIGHWVWLGAGMLGVFTAAGAFTAHAFWKVSRRKRVEAFAVFLMHFGLIAAFVMCALVAEREGRAVQFVPPSAGLTPATDARVSSYVSGSLCARNVSCPDWVCHNWALVRLGSRMASAASD